MRIGPAPSSIPRAGRLALDRPATVRDPSRAPIDVLVRNLSATGALLDAEETLPVGTLVSLGLAGIGIHLGRVVRPTPAGMAIEFLVPLDPQAMESHTFLAEHPIRVARGDASASRDLQHGDVASGEIDHVLHRVGLGPRAGIGDAVEDGGVPDEIERVERIAFRHRRREDHSRVSRGFELDRGDPFNLGGGDVDAIDKGIPVVGELGLPAHAFARQDEGDDLGFYAPPRLVTHIDAGAVAALTGLYRDTITAGGRVLDLMSSWVSHLPDDIAYGEVVGHGMNAEELASNPRLDRWFVRDLNAQPILPEGDGHYDAALICVGVQYLQRPLAVLREVRRVIVPGGATIVSFSTRRLQLAAEEGDTTALLLRRWRRSTRDPLSDPSAAVTRWRIACAPSAPLPVQGVGRPRWDVALVRQRGGDPCNWLLEACDAQGRLAVPAKPRDRPAAPARHGLRQVAA